MSAGEKGRGIRVAGVPGRLFLTINKLINCFFAGILCYDKKTLTLSRFLACYLYDSMLELPR